MRYLGNKTTQSRKLIPFFNNLLVLTPGVDYYEPFCGMCSVMKGVKTQGGGRRFAGDVNPDVVGLWKALQGGWQPPTQISKERWRELSRSPISTPERTFAGFGCTIFGQWFRGYDATEGVAESAARSLLSTLDGCRDVEFSCKSYEEWKFTDRAVVYCDPPYEGTENQVEGAFASFNYPFFWYWVREMFTSGIRIYVSTYQIPSGFKPVLDLSKNVRWPGEKVARWKPEYLVRPMKAKERFIDGLPGRGV